MDWIKRNLYFLIGSLAAVILMGLAGWYFYSKWQLNNTILGQLDEQYSILKTLREQHPHPGNAKIDNIQKAQEQQKELLAYVGKAHQYFEPCPPIPDADLGKLTSQDFSSALSRTIDKLRREAEQASVNLPSKDSSGNQYSFSFTAQGASLAYAPGSLAPLAVQLGEVKTICDVLFAAKINSLEGLRRERVSDDDLKGPQTDYLPDKSLTNELAVVSPYELSFRCFSQELAAVLAGYSSSPYSLVVKTINVEPAPATAVFNPQPTPAMSVAPAYTYPQPVPRPRMPEPAMSPEARFRDRYGLGGARPVPAPQPVYAQPVYQQPVPAPASKGGLPPALDEKELRVTLAINVIKLLPHK